MTLIANRNMASE